MNKWPKVKLGEVLSQLRREEKVNPSKEYRVLGARWYGEGLFAKDTKSGQAILATSVYRVEEGDFIYNRLFAWKGSFAVASKLDHGAYVSNEFPCFAINAERLEAHFLWWYFRRESAWAQAFGLSTGATPTSRNRLKERSFLSLEIPLPPLAEQRRIVARIEELAAQINEARELRRQAVAEAAVLLPSSMAEIFLQVGHRHPMPKLETLCDVVRGGSPRPAGSPLFYGGTIPFLKVGDLTKDDGMYVYEASASVNELGRAQSRFIEANTLMLTNSGATLGVPKITKIAGCFNDGSQAFLNLDSSVAKEYLYYLFKSKTLWFREQLARGQGQPNLNTDMTKQMLVPLPPLAEQRRIVSELDALQLQVDALKRLQAETAAALDALLPAVLDKAFKGEL